MKARRSTETVTPKQCAVALMETVHPIMQLIRVEMRSQREPSLSVPQFRVLAFLNAYPNSSLSDVAEHLGVTRATASTMTDRLVQRGLVHKSEDPQERRQIRLKLTPTGSDRLQEMQTVTQHKIADRLGELSQEELSDIYTGLALLAQVFTPD